jgi:hypothetical protein
VLVLTLSPRTSRALPPISLLPLLGPCREQLRKEVDASRKALRSIRNQLLAVQSRLAAQQQVNPSGAAAVKQALTSRHHDLMSGSANDGNRNSHQLLRDSNFQPTMALYNVYEEKLTALREERKKADGLLAKAERMLNIARIDSLHSAKTKKAALEELKYATSKLRRYQDLRSKSQHCQMDAVSSLFQGLGFRADFGRGGAAVAAALAAWATAVSIVSWAATASGASWAPGRAARFRLQD